MDQNSTKRPTDRGKTTVTRERPRTPASRPKDSRPRKGNASGREAARKERLSRQAAPAPEEEPGKAAPSRKKKKPHRVYNTNFGFKFLTMLAVVAVIVLSMIIFFKVKHVEVVFSGTEEGRNPYYTAEEITAASGINLEDNLLSLSKATVAARIHAALPYVNEVQIKKQLPGTVILTVSEFEVTYGIQDERGGWWLMSREGRILEAADEPTVRGHLTVTGMPIQVPEIGDYFSPASTEGADMSEIANKQKVVLEIIPALEETPFAKQIVSIDVSTSYDLTLWYGSRYEIRLGTTENLAYKLQTFQAILEQGSLENKSGTVDLTFNEDNRVHFLEFR